MLNRIIIGVLMARGHELSPQISFIVSRTKQQVCVCLWTEQETKQTWGLKPRSLYWYIQKAASCEIALGSNYYKFKSKARALKPNNTPKARTAVDWCQFSTLEKVSIVHNSLAHTTSIISSLLLLRNAST